ncbi:MAG: 23S rRNA (pseudouridine(1915)-N(3))-methyltransferase RlmH [Pseudomonadota bacterium]
MKIRLLAVGQRQPQWVDTAVSEYAKRLPRHLGFELIEVPAANRVPGNGAKATSNTAQQAEALRISKLLKPTDRTIALDEHGRSLATRDVAAALEHWQQDGQNVALLIGGADGLQPQLLKQASERWSLSAMTLPHGLARVTIVEQLYRAWTLTQNHPYHRA